MNNNEQQKKIYIAPSIEVVELAHQANLLDASDCNGNCIDGDVGMITPDKDFFA